MKCTETPGCVGTFESDGYCSHCGALAPAETAAAPRPLVGSGVATGAGTNRTIAPSTSGIVSASSTSRRSRAFATRLVALPPVTGPDPGGAVMSDPQVAEDRRFCPDPNCGAPVGRQRRDAPARAVGYCPRCGQRYSFLPRLRAGDVVGGQYEIVGCLAHGGLGWIYLARDRNVDDVWRVLKGVLHDSDPEAVANAIDERRFLASVDHPNIVRIINFVEHDGAGYIVMEYVNGLTLRQVVHQSEPAHDGGRRPLPVTRAIAYVLEILPALAHLHDQGLLFCDFKPENVMCTAESVKLIDLGGVYRIGDETSPIYGSPGYQAPEIAETGPTVASDLFTVGRTLAVLCTRFPEFQGTYRFTLPPRELVPELDRYDAVYHLLQRATAPVPSERFQSAEDMADQLRGVLREIVAEETGEPVPAPSTHFTGKVAGRVDQPDWHALPLPLVDLDDPAAAYLATVATSEPDALVTALRAAPVRTIEVDLQLVRALLTVARDDDAAAVLAGIRRTDDWRVDWHTGLYHLAVGAPGSAVARFGVVYRHLPGELAPKLALAMAFELSCDWSRAAGRYDVVSRTDSSFTAAAFGLARCHEALGDRTRAVDAYDRVPETSSRYADAQVAAARLSLGPEADLPAITAAGRTIEGLTLDPARRAAVTVDVLQAALSFVLRERPTFATGSVLGAGLTEPGLRDGLERAYRTLARYAPTAQDRIALVDRANRVRRWSVV
jgi:serine/threonine-protein kinase PknG